MTVLQFRKIRIPRGTHKCLAKLVELARLGRLHGFAFVGYLDDGFIADACGEAHRQPDETHKMLDYLKTRITEGRGID